MKGKKKKILDSSMKLFATKGFSSTSIQEIATDAGISKGSFYLYFKSKEALLVAIFQYHYDNFKKELEALRKENLPPRDLFIEQLVRQYKSFLSNKDFIIMHARESAIPINKEIADFIYTMREDHNKATEHSLLAIYGENISTHLFPLTILIQGITQSFFDLLLADASKINLHDLAAFILKRTDDMAFGLMESNELPIVNKEDFSDLKHCLFSTEEAEKQEIVNLIKNIKIEYKDSEDIFITLDVLAEEIESDKPRIPVIQGMIVNLEKEKKLHYLYGLIRQFFHLS